MYIHPDDFDIKAVRQEFIGKVVGRATGRYPVEYDAIRRHAHMTGDTNPLFLDPEFAKSEGPYGEVIVPPSLLLLYFCYNGNWPPEPKTSEAEKPARPFFARGILTPGDRGINMGTEFEFFEPVKVGDQLRSETIVTDVFVKGIKIDPVAVWVVSETPLYNQHDSKVAVWKNTMLIHRSPEQIAHDEKRGGAADD